jgi:hypothetical protein
VIFEKGHCGSFWGVWKFRHFKGSQADKMKTGGDAGACLGNLFQYFQGKLGTVGQTCPSPDAKFVTGALWTWY